MFFPAPIYNDKILVFPKFWEEELRPQSLPRHFLRSPIGGLKEYCGAVKAGDASTSSGRRSATGPGVKSPLSPLWIKGGIEKRLRYRTLNPLC